MDARDDALVAAAAEILHIGDVARSINGAVATVGSLPSSRAGSTSSRAACGSRSTRALPTRSGSSGSSASSGSTAAGGSRRRPTFTGAPADALGRRSRRGLPQVELASGAGHDAGVLARAGVPSVMLFVRAQNGGVSHSPDEHTTPEDVALAIDVLTDALDRLASA